MTIFHLTQSSECTNFIQNNVMIHIEILILIIKLYIEVCMKNPQSTTQLCSIITISKNKDSHLRLSSFK